MERSGTEELILVLEMSRTKRVSESVRERTKSNLCLALEDDASECQCKQEKCGVCTRHYNRLRYELLGMSEQQQALHKARLIRIGRLLKNGEAKKLRRRESFSRLA